jgi:UDP-N-acetyl-D-glucosamine dehydrogenase
MAKIAIIGQGYVGLTITAFTYKKFEVVGFDSNKTLVDNLNSGKSHIEGVPSEVLKDAVKSGKYKATADGTDLKGSDIVLIAVPTPLTADRKPDLKYIEAACKTIAENLESRALIINESTSYPGTIRDLIKPLIEKLSNKPLNHMYAISPERVDPGRTDWDQKNTPRLFSGLTDEASQATRSFYSQFCDNLVQVSSPEVAEAAKLFENTFRQVNIALVNEFAQITHAMGIAVDEVLDAANTKPYGFMKFTPSAGVGGHCIPVDPTYLAFAAAEKGTNATFIQRANEVNLEMPAYIVERVIEDNGGSIQGKSVQVIGVAYKANVADARETPAALLITALKAKGAIVTWHDPIVGKWNGESSTSLGGSELAIVVARHSAFSDSEILSSAGYVFDTTGTVAGATKL